MSNGIPEELRERFNQVFELKTEMGPFDESLESDLLEASVVACRGRDFLDYMRSSLNHIDLIMFLRRRRTKEIVAFAMVGLRVDIPVAILSLICAKAGDNVSYGIILHGLLAKELMRLGIEEIALSSVDDNDSYYNYLGYRRALVDGYGRAILRTTDGRAMIMDDIQSSNLLKIFSGKLERTLGILQSFASPIPLLEGQIKQSSNWQNLSRFWRHSILPAGEARGEDLVWVTDISAEAPLPSVGEKVWNLSYSFQEQVRTLRESDWISSFQLNVPGVVAPHAFVMAREHANVVELFPWVSRNVGKTASPLGLALLVIAAALLLRSMKKAGFEKAVAVSFVPQLLKKMGFRKTEFMEEIIVPTTKSLYVMDLKKMDLKRLTNGWVKTAWDTQTQFFPSVQTPNDFLALGTL